MMDFTEAINELNKINDESLNEGFGYSKSFYKDYLDKGYSFVFDQHDEDDFSERLVSEPKTDLETCINMNDDMKYFLPSYWEIYYKVDNNKKIVTVYDAITKDNLMC